MKFLQHDYTATVNKHYLRFDYEALFVFAADSEGNIHSDSGRDEEESMQECLRFVEKETPQDPTPAAIDQS